MTRFGDWVRRKGYRVVAALVALFIAACSVAAGHVGPGLVAALVTIPLQVVWLLLSIDTIIDHYDEEELGLAIWILVATALTTYVLAKALL